jgi:hypothetical protein
VSVCVCVLEREKKNHRMKCIGENFGINQEN